MPCNCRASDASVCMSMTSFPRMQRCFLLPSQKRRGTGLLVSKSRQKSRRKLGGQNRKKTVRKLARQHTRVACIRRNAAHQLTNSLVKHHALIAIEDLHVAGMLKNHALAGAVS